MRTGAAILAVLVIMSTLAGAKERKLFPATKDSVPAENRSADAAGLKRYNDRREIIADTERGVLARIPCSRKVPAYRRVALPDTVGFFGQLDADYLAATGRGLNIDSAIRSRDDQRRLRKSNRNATEVDGERASSHERGTTFDLSKRMTRAQYRWLLWRLAYYKLIGRILVIEEKSCIHIFVIPQEES